MTNAASVDYALLNLPVVDARVDWITATAKRGPRANELIDFAERELLAQEVYGDKFEEWRFQGYRGFRCGQARWGWGKHGGCVVFTQERAQSAAPDLARLADHWSRIDYAVTAFDRSGTINPCEQYWGAYACRYPGGRSPVRMGRIQELGAGSTLSLGSRTAATYFRCYDKHHESKAAWALGTWRWELELKREQAEAAHTRWRESLVLPSYIASMVAAWPESHGLQMPWDHNLSNWQPLSVRPVRDADRSLQWLESQVAPTVEWVSAARGEQVVLAALHLLA